MGLWQDAHVLGHPRLTQRSSHLPSEHSKVRGLGLRFCLRPGKSQENTSPTLAMRASQTPTKSELPGPAVLSCALHGSSQQGVACNYVNDA